MRIDTEAGRGKEFIPEAELVATFRDRMVRYQAELERLARERRDAAAVRLDSWKDFEEAFSGDKSTFAWCHWDGTRETEAAIKEATQVTIRCVPLDGQGPAAEAGACIKSGKPSTRRVLMAKAY
jgi:prolyl-tRNA synthetase